VRVVGVEIEKDALSKFGAESFLPVSIRKVEIPVPVSIREVKRPGDWTDPGLKWDPVETTQKRP